MRIPHSTLGLSLLFFQAISTSAYAGQWDEPAKAGEKKTDADAKPADKNVTLSETTHSEKTEKTTVVEPIVTKAEADEYTEEDPKKTYMYLGARYRGTILPKFMMNLFVNEGATVYLNTIGVELDVRKDGDSKIFALQYTEYGLGDTLFLEKGKDASFAGNWSNVRSNMKSLFLTADFLWSAKLSRKVDFEYGLGVGIGAVFGDLENNWVYKNSNGPYKTADGSQTFSPCITEGDGSGCARTDHTNASTARVNHYMEKSLFDGGAQPPIFIHLSIPQFGIRYRPMKELETRFGLGFSLTGFWFGFSANYGFPPSKAANEPVKETKRPGSVVEEEDPKKK